MQKISRTIEAEESFFSHIMKSWHHDTKIPQGVVFVLPRPGRTVLTMTKGFYPEGIYRLTSGGMHKGETPQEAFYREVKEETGLKVAPVEKLAEIDLEVVHEGKSTHYYQHVFLAEESSGPIHTEDEDEQITGFREVPVDDLPKLVEQLRSLDEPWRGWGEFWVASHEVAYRTLKMEDSK